MAQLVDTNIDIDGKSIKQFSSLNISQGIYEHHLFTLVCPAEAIDGTSGLIFNSSKNMIGSSINIKMDAVGSSGTMKFSGVITQVEAERYNGHAGNIVISGFSPTILLDNGPHCQTWEKKTLKNIAQAVVENFPKNLLQPSISPSYGDTMSYTVQYKETAWQFLYRLSVMHGEWFYYDGRKLVLGPPKGNTVKLNYGSNLQQFSMALQVRPTSFQVMAYDYMNHEVYTSSPKDIASKDGLNDLGKFALQKSEKFYDSKPKQWNNQFLTDKKQLDDFANVRASVESSNMVRFTGTSDHPGIQVGGTASIQGRNVFSQANETFGDYSILSVNHQCNGQGNYTNFFVSIPSSVKMSPVTVYPEPRCETQSATVTDNNDPNGLGRVRVRFHWMETTEKSPWIRVTSAHGGGGKGMFFMPEVGEEVIVGFESDSPTKPYIIGSVFHGKAKSSSGNSGNDVKQISTRAGSSIAFDDSAGSLKLTDKNGSHLTMDGKGNLTMDSKESIKLTCGGTTIQMSKDGKISITGKEINIEGSAKAILKSGPASFAADGQGGDAKMDGMNVTISGTVESKLKANAQITIDSAGIVDIKGAMIKKNG
ncbi:MAG: type VI secretion system tip protein VgrG [Puia sp.]